MGRLLRSISPDDLQTNHNLSIVGHPLAIGSPSSTAGPFLSSVRGWPSCSAYTKGQWRQLAYVDGKGKEVVVAISPKKGNRGAGLLRRTLSSPKLACAYGLRKRSMLLDAPLLTAACLLQLLGPWRQCLQRMWTPRGCENGAGRQ